MELGIPRFSLPVNLDFKRLASTVNGFQSYSRYRGTPDVKVRFCPEFEHAERM